MIPPGGNEEVRDEGGGVDKEGGLYKAYGLGMQLGFNMVLINENDGSIMRTSMNSTLFTLGFVWYPLQSCSVLPC